MKIQLVLIFAALISMPALANDSIMITAFMPFQGRPVNQSRAIGEALVKTIQRRGIGGEKFDATLCLLPTVYDKGAAAAEKCYQAMAQKPKIVLSLGESACELKLETQAKNWDSAGMDNELNDRTGSQIIPGAPEFLALGFPAENMLRLLSSFEKNRVTLSTSMGGFVCNNTAYLLGNYFATEPTTYGFIHVPQSDCGGEADPTANARTIAKMLKAVL